MNLRAAIWARVSSEPQADDDTKDSIPTQLSQARELCARENWDIVAELIVPGFSSDYIDFHELARDARNANPPIHAFDELAALWETRGMDILIVRDGSRFARTRSLHGYFVDRTILQCKASIYSFADGMIDERNAGIFHSMSSYQTVNERERLVQRHKIGMNKLAERGFPTNRTAILSHRVVRDELGRRLCVEVRPEFRAMWDALEKILLAGTSWAKVEAELFKLGYTAANGKPYLSRKFFYLLHNPYFWGNSGTNYYDHYGLWAFDSDEPVPSGAIIYRDTHEATYTGIQADRVKSEIRRRSRENGVVVGSARPDTPHWFSGLVICDECGKCTSTAKRGKYLRCHSFWSGNTEGCTQSKHLRTDALKIYVDSWLRQMLSSDDLTSFFAAGVEDHAVTVAQLRSKEAQLAGLLNDINTLVDDRLNARTPEVRQIYSHKIASAETQLENLKALILDLRHKTEQENNLESRERSIEELAKLGIDNLWNEAPHRINQLLYNILGSWRFRMRDAEIKGRMKTHRRRKPR
jgi:DNA invertase Pin-like site-specific DNA recombinase